MVPVRQRKSLFSRIKAMLNSLKTSLGWPEAARRIKPTLVVRTPPRESESSSLEILQLVHDLRNQLMIMRLSATNILDGSLEGRARRLDQLQQSVERAALLINALLLNEQAVLPGRRPVDANEIVRRTAATLSHGPSDPVCVELHLWPEPLPILAEAGDLDRTLLNLVLNAFDAMPDGGVLTIETTIDHVRESSEATPSGPCARLTVTDTGCGMTAEVKDRIFDAFFTTKKGGTGLGLRSVAFTVQQLQGQISVDSEPGRGTSVSLLFPLAKEGSILNFSARLSDSNN